MNSLFKLMIVGSDKVYAIENCYVKYFRQFGIETDQFLAQTFFYDYYQAGYLHKILFKAGLSGIIEKINKQFLERVAEWKPDVIWIFKGMEIMPSSLEKVKKTGVKLVNFNGDNPFIFTGKGSGNKYVRDSIGLYDLHFTYNLEIETALKKKFNAETAFLPFGFEIEDQLFEKCAAKEEIVKACFLGNPDKKRAAFIQSLAEEGVKIDVYGNNWDKFLNHGNITICEPVYGDKLWEVLRSYRVQLNLMRIHNEDSHNMRSFEVPGIGGIMVAPDTTEHRIFFEDGKEVFLFREVTDCAQKINSIIALSKEEALVIRQNARIRSINSGYSYKDRSAFAYQTILKLNG